MKVFTKEITFATEKNRELANITAHVQRVLENSEIKNGICLVYAPHATGAIIIDEDEAGLKQDLLDALWKIIPERGNYQHDKIDNNAHAHLKSAIVGCSKTVPIVDGHLGLGTWQSIFFLESDGPRTRRRVTLVLMGE